MDTGNVTAIIGIVGVVVGGIISSGTTLLVHRSDRKRFQREKSWDARRQAYAEIVGALDRAQAISKLIDDEFQCDPHGWHANPASTKAQNQLVDFMQKARIAFHDQTLFLSGDFRNKYEQLIAEIDASNNPNLLPPELADAVQTAIRDRVPELRSIATRELGM